MSQCSAEKDEVLKIELQAAALEGRLDCASAMALADRLNLPRKHVGAMADQMGIRIKNCQLGCF